MLLKLSVFFSALSYRKFSLRILDKSRRIITMCSFNCPKYPSTANENYKQYTKLTVSP